MNRHLAFHLGFLIFASTMAGAYEPGKFYFQANTKEKVIALTFDDGPGAFTPQILDFLKAHQAGATFFIEGDQVAAYPQFVRREVQEGFEVANHTYSHLDFHKVKNHPADVFAREYDQTENAIRTALGDPQFQTKAVRMPHGAYGKFNRDWLLPFLRERGSALVHWTFGTDWFLKKSAEQMAEEYLKNAHPGAVLLFHDGGRHREKTLAALKIVVPTLQERGYRLVAARDLFT